MIREPEIVLSRRRISHLVALLLYVLYTVLIWGLPVLSHLKSRLVGTTADPTLFIYALKWWPWALSHHTNPLIDHWIWAPTGQFMLWVTSVPAISAFLWPVTHLAGPVAAYNIAMLVSPLLASWSMYLLLSLLVPRWGWRFWGGICFGFSSYQIGQMLGHLNLTWVFFLPLLVMLSVKVYQCFERGSRPSLGISLAFIASAVVLFFTSTEIFTTLTFFSIVFGAVTLIVFRHQLTRSLKLLLKWIAINVVIVIILLLPMVIYLLQHPFYHGTPFNPKTFSTDLLNFIIPTGMTIGGPLTLGISGHFVGNYYEDGAYLGIPMIALIVIATKRLWALPWIRALTYTMLIIAVCSFGPVLHIDGKPTIAMPWTLMLHVPLIRDALPARFSLYISFIATIVATIGLDRIAGGLLPDETSMAKSTHLALLIIAVLAPVMLVPNVKLGKGYLWTPYHIPSFFTQPSLYQKYLPAQSTVMIFPYGMFGDAQTMQSSAHFWFKLANGYMGAPPPPYQGPMVEKLFFERHPPILPTYPKDMARLIARQNVSRVVAVNNLAPYARKLLSAVPDLTRIYQGHGVVVWSLNQK
ncbi:MAG: hypothetical protein C7B46_11375 [Sulfobacillus benefaciens]|uniref:Glycosyltransferase RgtA/B/C/D-like domain-containing protein n=1 Tax=Sulfobacillus benefaciens TaxID=453960 RepID=A0A2T2XF79_9FIRM|nr:MAG: hypothetical protein C7B46_11375 [Sulfobacillus benefaciens]